MSDALENNMELMPTESAGAKEVEVKAGGGGTLAAIYKTVFDTEQKPPRSPWLIVCEDIPLINLVYDLIFDEDPSPDGLKDALNLVGLVDALILGFMLALLTAVDYSELTEADERFMHPLPDQEGYAQYYNGDQYFDRAAPSASFAFYCYTSTALMFVSLNSVLLVYLDFINKDFTAKTKEESAALFAARWRYGKVCLLLCFIACMVGVYYASFSISYVLLIKYPDYYVEKHGKIKFSTMFPYGGYNYAMLPILSVIVVVIFCLGMGTRSRYRCSRMIEREEKKQQLKFQQDDSYKQWAILLEPFSKEGAGGTVVYKELMNQISVERLNYSDRSDMTDEHLVALGVVRLGHRMLILKLIREAK